jgi:xanthine dehydrogenase molybdopterin-binding subunit B
VDVGQLEGAFMMGLGLVMNEHMEADPDSGE